ncbi:MAG: DUF6433 family protein [Minisyncoccia bacterium]
MKYLTEVLEEINADPKTIEKYKNDVALKILFEYAYLPEKKFDLPEGDPPYKPDDAPIGMSPANLRMEIKRLYIFKREDLKPLRREQLFINLLESVHPDEAKLLLAVKEQKLNKLYKKVTRKVVEEAGFIPVLEKVK